MPRFMLFTCETAGSWDRLPPDEQTRLVGLYRTWAQELRRSGAFVDGDPIGGPGRVLRPVNGAWQEGPFERTEDLETGYFLIEASDLAVATAIARGCPALLHGESVVVRPVGH